MKDLGFKSQPAVSVAMKPLFNEGMIKRIKGGGYRLNSQIVSIGSIKEKDNAE